MMPRILFCFLLLFMCFSCEKQPKPTAKHDKTEQPIPGIGKILSPDSIAKPAPIRAGKPHITPAGKPVEVIIENHIRLDLQPQKLPIQFHALKTFTPGNDAIKPPSLKTFTDSQQLAKHPQPVNFQGFRMKDAANLNIRYMDLEQGLSSYYYRKALQDRKGNIWFASFGGGVSKFNGKSFFHYTENEGLSSNLVECILEDRQGNIWFGTYGGGVTKYDGKYFSYFNESNGLSSNYVIAMLEDKNENIWFATDNEGGVVKFDGNSFFVYKTENGLSSNMVISLSEDKQGNLWFGTYEGGITRFNGKTFTHLTTNDGLPVNDILSLFTDKSGAIWIGTDGAGLLKFDGESFYQYGKSQGFTHPSVSHILQDSKNNLWFSTKGGGAMMYNGTYFTPITEKNGLSYNNLNGMLEDNAGKIWFLTYGGGLSHYDPSSFVHFSHSDGLPDNVIVAIEEDEAGNIWLASARNGVYRFEEFNKQTDAKTKQHLLKNYNEKSGLRSTAISSIFKDKAGNLWFGADPGGLIKFNGKQFEHYTENEGLGSNYIISVFEDQSGNLWVGSYGGGISKLSWKEKTAQAVNAANFNIPTITNYTTKEGLSSNYIYSISQDNAGNMWFGTYEGGITKFDHINFTHITEVEGTPITSVWCMLHDSRNQTWFGTEGAGLVVFDGKKFSRISAKDGLSSNTVQSMVEDPTGRMWIATTKGLNCLVPDSTLRANEPSTKQYSGLGYSIETFHKEDGLKTENFVKNSVLLDRKNRLWWGTGKSLSMLDLNKFYFNQNKPEIRLEGIEIMERFIDFNAYLEKPKTSETNDFVSEIKFDAPSAFENYPIQPVLPYNLNFIRFNFSAIDWHTPHKLLFQYKLEGLDKGWSQLSSNITADYRNIPYGKYSFKVRALSGAKQWSAETEFPFTITPPWWRTWWAYLVYFGLFILIILLAVRIYSRRLRMRAEMLSTKVNQATIEIRQQNEELERQKQVIEKKHKEITDSINYAERIQRSFLATEALLKQHLNDYFIFFQPKDVVSGDFYWAAELPNGKFAFVVADSTGHGVPGAIMSVLNILSLEMAMGKNLLEPSDILNYARNEIIERLKKDGSTDGGSDGMDASLLVYDKISRMLHYACANNPIWIVRNHALIELKADKMPVGKHAHDTIPFSQGAFQLQTGDVVYCLTDGLADQFGGPEGKKYKSKALKTLLISIAHQPMAKQEMIIKETFENWKGELEQVDDVALSGIRIG